MAQKKSADKPTPKHKPGKPGRPKKIVPKPIPKKGAPTKYRPEYDNIAKALATKGMIDEHIAGVLGVTHVTFMEWKKQYPSFLRAVKEGKAEPDEKVVTALYENAIGGVYRSKKPMVVSDGIQRGSHVEIVELEERIPPNVTAQIFWLKNRKPENWADKHSIDHSGVVGYKVIPDDLSELIEDESQED